MMKASKKELKFVEAVYFLNKLIAENEKEAREWREIERFNISIIYSKQNEELEKIKKILEYAFSMKDE